MTLLAALAIGTAGCSSKDDSGGGGDGGDGDGADDGTGGGDGGDGDGTADDGGNTGDGGGGTGDDGGDDGNTGDGNTGDGNTGGDGGAFISEPDGGVVGQCDPGLQDCPNPDEKCSAYVTEPGYCCVDANKCVPIIGNKTFGDTCERTEENDDCDKGFFCMTKTSGSTGEGVCLEFCVPNAPDQCEFGGTCQPFNDGVLPLCEEECDPLVQDCPVDMGCYAAFDIFICAMPGYDDGKGNDGDDCYTIQSCLPGLVCVTSDAYGADCTGGDACCTFFCDLSEGGAGNPACSNPSHECVAWYAEGDAPPGLEDVGACTVPQ